MMVSNYGNPSSLHGKGLSAHSAVQGARESVARLMGAAADKVVFTSGGTQANNLAVIGGAMAMRRRGDTILISAFEHASVAAPAAYLEKNGFTVRRVAPMPDGTMDVGQLAAAVDEKTVLVSCMLCNSETGALTPIDELVPMIRRLNGTCLIHSDAVQAFGKLPISVKKLGVDLLTVSAHKIHAPKGCGALYMRKGARVLPLEYGGSQEKGLSPGTESTALIAAFGKAADLAGQNMADNHGKVAALCEYFVNKARSTAGLCMNSPPDATPYIRNISVPGYRSETMLHHLEAGGVYVSSGSACSKGAKSPVLTAMGLAPQLVDSALRVSFCRDNTEEDVDVFFEVLGDGMQKLVRSK
jgi:cysteine desulfurase